MTHYEAYEVEDFASNDQFIQWCLQPDKNTEQYWAVFIKKYPHKQAVVLEARQLILDLQELETEANEGSFEQEIWSKIEANIRPKRRLIKRPAFWATAAASILLIFTVFYNLQNTPASIDVAIEWINYENNSGLSKTIELADNSTVILEPFSTLKYPTAFRGKERGVFLKGEAFFDISRDTLKPFLVYANETVTKVLGTSFTITAFEGKKTVEVEVKTGKVAVYANVASNQNGKTPKQLIIQADERVVLPQPNTKLEVTPNQKVVFDKKEEKMIKTVAELPQVIPNIETPSQLVFEEAPIANVFEALEKRYGIAISYDNVALRNCTITTKLDKEPLFQKLNIICLALDLSYSESEAVIYVKGKGC